MGGVRPPRVREPLLALRGVDGRGGGDGGDCAAAAAAARSGSAKAELIIDWRAAARVDVAVGRSNGCNSNSPRVELRNHLYPSTYIFARAVLQENAPGSPRRVFERTSLGGRFDNENNFDDPREGFALARSAPIAEPKRAPKDRQVLRAESQWEKRRDHRRALCIENECCHRAMFASTAVAVTTRRRRAAVCTRFETRAVMPLC